MEPPSLALGPVDMHVAQQWRPGGLRFLVAVALVELFAHPHGRMPRGICSRSRLLPGVRWRGRLRSCCNTRIVDE